MRMAKTQKATLDPSKISGRCGRLMCCLRYEDVTYEELRKQLPRKNTWVKTEKILGKVVDTQIITQLVRLALLDNTQVVVANEEILERDVPAPPIPPPPPPQPERRHRVHGEGTMLRDTINPPPAPAAQGEPSQPAAAPEADVAQPASDLAARGANEPLPQEAATDEAAGVDDATEQGEDTSAPAGDRPSQEQPRGPEGDQRQGGRRRRHRRRGGGGGQGPGPNQGQGGNPQGQGNQQRGAPAGGDSAPQGGRGPNDGGAAMGGQGQGQGQGGGEGRRRRRRRHRGRGGSGGPGGGQGGPDSGGGGSPPPSAPPA